MNCILLVGFDCGFWFSEAMASGACSLQEFEEEVKRMLFISGDSYDVINSYYNELMEHSCNQRDTLNTEPVRLIAVDIVFIIRHRNICLTI